MGTDENDITGIYAQDFRPDQDTRHTKRKIAGFSPDYVSESFDISPDGRHVMLATMERVSNLMLVEGLDGVKRAE